MQLKSIMTSENFKKTLPFFVLNMVIAFTISFLTRSFLLAPRIVGVDLTGIVHQFMMQQTKQNVSQNELKIRMKKFGMELDRALAITVKKKHLVILPRQALIAGYTDYTTQIVKELNKTLDSSSQLNMAMFNDLNRK